MIGALLIIHAFVTVAMVGIILLQKSDGAGPLGIGGNANSLFTARGVANILTRATAFLATLFIGNCILIGILTNREIKNSSNMFAEQPAKVSKHSDVKKAPKEDAVKTEDSVKETPKAIEAESGDVSKEAPNAATESVDIPTAQNAIEAGSEAPNAIETVSPGVVEAPRIEVETESEVASEASSNELSE